jgi:hypothetical protein
MNRLLACLVVLLAAAPGLALGCAVPTRMELRNETAQRVRAVHIQANDERLLQPNRVNYLEGALEAGGVATITFPSCMGTYVLRVVFADGTEQTHPGIDAGRIRALSLR